jgi:hypothetical protein
MRQPAGVPVGSAAMLALCLALVFLVPSEIEIHKDAIIVAT